MIMFGNKEFNTLEEAPFLKCKCKNCKQTSLQVSEAMKKRVLSIEESKEYTSIKYNPATIEILKLKCLNE